MSAVDVNTKSLFVVYIATILFTFFGYKQPITFINKYQYTLLIIFVHFKLIYYPSMLLKSIKMGDITLPNRICMASLTR
jgi:hypothetical protein